MANKTIQTRQERRQRESKAQHDRSPMLAVRVPRSLYRALRKAARDDGREFPDWFRRNAPRLLELSPIQVMRNGETIGQNTANGAENPLQHTESK